MMETIFMGWATILALVLLFLGAGCAPADDAETAVSTTEYDYY